MQFLSKLWFFPQALGSYKALRLRETFKFHVIKIVDFMQVFMLTHDMVTKIPEGR